MVSSESTIEVESVCNVVVCAQDKISREKINRNSAMASDDDEGTKGNRKRVPIWSIVKNASFAITACFFVLLIVLSLDAYKFISVRVSWLGSCCNPTLEYPTCPNIPLNFSRMYLPRLPKMNK